MFSYRFIPDNATLADTQYNANDSCTVGFVLWNYPKEQIHVHFSHPNKTFAVCFRNIAGGLSLRLYDATRDIKKPKRLPRFPNCKFKYMYMYLLCLIGNYIIQYLFICNVLSTGSRKIHAKWKIGDKSMSPDFLQILHRSLLSSQKWIFDNFFEFSWMVLP